MRLVLLNESFEDISDLEFAEEVVAIKKYNDVGECKIKFGCDQDVVDLISESTYIVDYDHPDDYEGYETFSIYKISNVEITTSVNQGDVLNIVADDGLSILSDRAIINPIIFNGHHPAELLLELFKDCYSDNKYPRKSSLVIINESSFQSLIDKHKDDEYIADVDVENNFIDLLSRVLEICQAFNYGIKVRYCPDLDGGKFIVSVYSGEEKNVEFSPNFRNISDTEYTQTRSYKNVAIVKGQSGKATISSTEDTTPVVIVWEGYPNLFLEPYGDDRREVIIDASSDCSREFTKETLDVLFPNTSVAQMDNDDTKGKLYDEYYIPLLVNYGVEALKSLKSESTFSGELEIDNMYEYKVDYDLGDIVVAKNRYDLGGTTRVVEIWESRDNTGVDILEPKFKW